MPCELWEGDPLPHQEVFAAWGLKRSNLMHILGEFVRILSTQKSIGQEITCSQNMCLPQVGDGRRGSEVTERGKGVGGGYPPPIREFCTWGGRVQANLEG